MRAKQVTALMMAATLAVTSNGVTALAAETGDSSAAVAEVTENVESLEIEETVKGAATSADDATLTTTSDKTEVTYGDTVTVTSKVETENTKYTVDEFKLYAGDTSDEENVIASNTTGEFTFAPESGKTYTVRVVFSVSGQMSKKYVDSVLSGYTVNDVTVASSKLHVPDVTTITNTTTTAPTVAADEVVAALKAANESDKAYGVWTCTNSDALVTGEKYIDVPVYCW